MPITQSSAANLRAGQATRITPPSFSDIANAVEKCVIFNTSPYVLTVVGPFGTALLQAFSADIFDCPGIQGIPTVTPTAIAAVNNYIGAITAQFYYQGDQPPQNYPISLPTIPGGATLLAVATGLTSPITLQPPPYSTTLTVQVMGAVTGVALTGVQSSTTYQAATTIAANGTLSIPIGSDTSYSLAWTGATAPTNVFSTAGAISPTPDGHIYNKDVHVTSLPSTTDMGLGSNVTIRTMEVSCALTSFTGTWSTVRCQLIGKTSSEVYLTVYLPSLTSAVGYGSKSFPYSILGANSLGSESGFNLVVTEDGSTLTGIVATVSATITSI